MLLFPVQWPEMVLLIQPLVIYGYTTELFGKMWVKLQARKEPLVLLVLQVPQVLRVQVA
jgi:hypothetical protein